MTTIDALLIGVLSTLVGIGIFMAGQKVWALLRILPSLRDTINKQVIVTIDLLAAARAIAQELQYMRALAQSQANPNAGQEGMNPFSAPQPGPVPPFPAPIFDRFKTAPDATVEDTDDVSLSQTDEDMAQMEAIEKLRSQGVQIDEPDVEHPGVTVESE